MTQRSDQPRSRTADLAAAASGPDRGGPRHRRGRALRGALLAGLLCVTAVGAASCSSDDAGGAATTTTAARGQGADPKAGAEPRSGTYLSLGDSYSVGAGATDPAKGYADLLPGLLAEHGWDLELVNLGCGGATVGSLAEGDGCQPAMRAHDAEGYDTSQLDAAVAYLEDHPGEVALITVSIGGNDVTKCARGADDPIACVTDAVSTIDAGLEEILTRLRDAAGPDTTIVGLTYPDVILGAWLNEGTRPLAELSVVAFEQFINPMYEKRYEAVDGIFVDITEGTGGYTPLTETTELEGHGEVPVAVAEVCELTWFCDVADIHPKDAGYERIAALVVQALTGTA